MPSRRRPKTSSNLSAPSRAAASPVSTGASKQTDIERFAAALKDSEKAERAEKARKEQDRTNAAQRAEQSAAKAAALKSAQRDLERAVEAVRSAKQVGRGRAEADEAWKIAKALVIELETGIAPAWAPKPAPIDEPTEVTEPDTPEESDDAQEP